MIFQKNQIHAFTPFKLRGKPHSKCKKSISHKKMVVSLQPQCDFCKDTMHHHKKRGLPRRFTTYFDSFCSNPKNDTGLPLIYIVLAECTWLWWHKIPVLSPLKLIIFVNIVLNWNNRSANLYNQMSKTKFQFKVQNKKSKCEYKFEAKCQNNNQLKRFSVVDVFKFWIMSVINWFK